MANNVYAIPGDTAQEVVDNALSKTFSFTGTERVVVVDALAKEVTVINGSTNGLTKKRTE